MPSAHDDIPALWWLLEKGKDVRTALQYAGNPSWTERAQIANWFEAHISKDTNLRSKWIGLLPMAHAITIFIAYRSVQGKHNRTAHLAGERLRAAWEDQLEIIKYGVGVDVDRECLARLEERMFERSQHAGIAGHFQWGLDTGDHQDCWNPYEGLPKEWDHGDRQGDAKECLVRAFLSTLTL